MRLGKEIFADLDHAMMLLSQAIGHADMTGIRYRSALVAELAAELRDTVATLVTKAHANT